MSLCSNFSERSTMCKRSVHVFSLLARHIFTEAVNPNCIIRKKSYKNITWNIRCVFVKDHKHHEKHPKE